MCVIPEGVRRGPPRYLTAAVAGPPAQPGRHADRHQPRSPRGPACNVPPPGPEALAHPDEPEPGTRPREADATGLTVV